jgi:1-acyl-sn-glycerol-3-phosphate acyltransferase
MGLRRNLRVARRIGLGVLALPFLATGLVAQMAVVGPLFPKSLHLQRFSYSVIRSILGIKIEFNSASAPIEKNKPTWFVGNHQSQADIITLGSTLHAAFAGKGTFMQNKWIAPIGRSVHYIGLRRVPKDHEDYNKFQDQARGKVSNNFNAGRNLITFQEGTTTDGSEVKLFRAGLLKTLFTRGGADKEGNPIKLEGDVVVQPVGIKVKSVEGLSTEEREDLRHYYSHYTSKETLKRIISRLATKEIVLELKAFEPLNPADFADEKELANKACDLIRSFVSPHQKDVTPAEIPNIDSPVIVPPKM